MVGVRHWTGIMASTGTEYFESAAVSNDSTRERLGRRVQTESSTSDDRLVQVPCTTAVISSLLQSVSHMLRVESSQVMLLVPNSQTPKLPRHAKRKRKNHGTAKEVEYLIWDFAFSLHPLIMRLYS